MGPLLGSVVLLSTCFYHCSDSFCAQPSIGSVLDHLDLIDLHPIYCSLFFLSTYIEIIWIILRPRADLGWTRSSDLQVAGRTILQQTFFFIAATLTGQAQQCQVYIGRCLSCVLVSIGYLRQIKRPLDRPGWEYSVVRTQALPTVGTGLWFMFRRHLTWKRNMSSTWNTDFPKSNSRRAGEFLFICRVLDTILRRPSVALPSSPSRPFSLFPLHLFALCSLDVQG